MRTAPVRDIERSVSDGPATHGGHAHARGNEGHDEEYASGSGSEYDVDDE